MWCEPANDAQVEQITVDTATNDSVPSLRDGINEAVRSLRVRIARRIEPSARYRMRARWPWVLEAVSEPHRR